MKKDNLILFIPASLFFIALAIVITPVIIYFYDSLPNHQQTIKKINIIIMAENKEKIPAIIKDGLLWVYLPEKEYGSNNNEFFPYRTIPSYLNWGNGVCTPLEFFSGNWIAYQLPEKRLKIFLFPKINEKEIDLPSRQQFSLERRMLLFNEN